MGEVTAIRGRRVITPDGERAATVLLRDGIITGLAGYAGAPPGTLTLAGDEVLLPGLVDSHVHVNEPGRTEWEGFATATAAAAAGGVTTIVDMPLNSIPPTVTVPALRAKQAAAAGQLAVDVAFWGGAVPGNVADLRPLHEAGVAGFKCFLLPSGVDEFPPLDPAQLGAAMAEIASFGGLLIAHAEDPGVIAAAPAAGGRRYADFLASRPPEAEQRAVAALLEQTRRTGCRTHIVHLASAAALPAVRGAQAAGLPVTAETCPHYLTLRAEDVPDGATQFKCCPPIRDDANRDALWAGLLDGAIGSVVSDHSPCPVAAKRLDTGDFGRGLGRHRLGPARAARRVDRGRPARRRPGPGGGLDGRGPGRAGRPGRPRRDRARAAGRPVRLRPGRAVRGGPGHPAAPPPGHPVRGPDPARRGPADLAGRPADRGRPAGRAAGVRGPRDGAAATAPAAGTGTGTGWGRSVVTEDPAPGRGVPGFEGLPDVASRALGGAVLYASDEFYADAHSLIDPRPATHDPAAFGARGKVYDGWETRRRREPGADFVIIRLAAPAIVRGVNIDTAHFRGNYPPSGSVDGATLLGYPTAAEVRAAAWTPLAGPAGLGGDRANLVPVTAPDRLVTHVRLTIYPDGGVARLRVFGEVVPDPRRLGGRVDLAATAAGGRVEACSNMFFSAPANVLAPGRAQVMSDGWETARRRDDGHDWLVVRLAVPGLLHHAVIDTSRFAGNAPGHARLSDAESGAELLPRTRLIPDAEHRFRLRGGEPDPAGPGRRTATGLVRLDIYPDGGISRLRLVGAVPPDRREQIARRWLALLPRDLAARADRGEFFD